MVCEILYVYGEMIPTAEFVRDFPEALEKKPITKRTKSHATQAAIVEFLTCHFTIVACRHHCKILQKSSFHGCLLCNFCSLALGFTGPATGVIWALRAQSCKESRKMSSRALLAPAQKVHNGVEKESK